MKSTILTILAAFAIISCTSSSNAESVTEQCKNYCEKVLNATTPEEFDKALEEQIKWFHSLNEEDQKEADQYVKDIDFWSKKSKKSDLLLNTTN